MGTTDSSLGKLTTPLLLVHGYKCVELLLPRPYTPSWCGNKDTGIASPFFGFNMALLELSYRDELLARKYK